MKDPSGSEKPDLLARDARCLSKAVHNRDKAHRENGPALTTRVTVWRPAAPPHVHALCREWHRKPAPPVLCDAFGTPQPPRKASEVGALWQILQRSNRREARVDPRTSTARPQRIKSRRHICQRHVKPGNVSSFAEMPEMGSWLRRSDANTSR